MRMLFSSGMRMNPATEREMPARSKFVRADFFTLPGESVSARFIRYSDAIVPPIRKPDQGKIGKSEPCILLKYWAKKSGSE